MVSVTVVVTNAVVWAISNCVLVPIEAYYAYQIYDCRDSHVITKRKPRLLLISVVSSIVFYALFQTFLLLLSCRTVSSTYYSLSDESAEWAVLLTLGTLKALFLVIVPMAFMFHMTHRLRVTKHYHDNIGLGREVKFCTIAYVMILVIRVIDFAIVDIALENTEDREIFVSLVVTLAFFAQKLFGFAINLKQTRWIIVQFGSVVNRYSSREIGALAHQKTLMKVSPDSLQQNEAIRMGLLLRNVNSFDLFMAYCSSEHCAECVLVMVEILQWKQKVFKELPENERTRLERERSELGERDVFTLPDKCPQSDIVFVGERTLKAMAREMYLKYIREGSDWEINLNSRSRRRYTALFENGEAWEGNVEYEDAAKLYGVFDDCLREMTGLIRAAYSRFKQTNQFKVLQNKSKSIQTITAGRTQSLTDYLE